MLATRSIRVKIGHLRVKQTLSVQFKEERCSARGSIIKRLVQKLQGIQSYCIHFYLYSNIFDYKYRKNRHPGSERYLQVRLCIQLHNAINESHDAFQFAGTRWTV